MSRSQFQSKRFILRHAWLNLWDERMTTGRINQVAIFPIELWEMWRATHISKENMARQLPPSSRSEIWKLEAFRPSSRWSKADQESTCCELLFIKILCIVLKLLVVRVHFEQIHSQPTPNNNTEISLQFSSGIRRPIVSRYFIQTSTEIQTKAPDQLLYCIFLRKAKQQTNKPIQSQIAKENTTWFKASGRKASPLNTHSPNCLAALFQEKKDNC